MFIFATALAMASADRRPPEVDILSGAVSDADLCEAMGGLSNRLQERLPVMVDEITRTDRFHVQCSAKMVAWDKTIFAATERLDQGWRTQKQAEWTASICENPIFRSMQTRGWHFVQNLTLADGRPLIMEAEMCP